MRKEESQSLRRWDKMASSAWEKSDLDWERHKEDSEEGRKPGWMGIPPSWETGGWEVQSS